MILILLSLLLPTYISGQEYGNIDDFRISPLDDGKSAKISRYAGTSQVVRIPPIIHGMAITEIGDEAFMDKEIISITIPNSVIIIGKRAFANNKFINLTIPDSVTVIEEEAFSYLSGTSRAINFKFSRMGRSSNNWDARIKNLTLGNSITTIKKQAFYYNQIKSVVIPDSVGIIEDEAFSGNELTSVAIGKGVIYLSGFDHNSLTDITIPNSVTTIGEKAFMSNNLKNITIPNSVTQILGGAFFDNQITSITIGSNVEFRRSEFQDAFFFRFEEYYRRSANRRAGTYVRNDNQWSIK
jgi:hypothetical protein